MTAWEDMFEPPVETNAIESFTGVYSFLSNMHLVRIRYDGEWYHSVEHAYVAAKTLDQYEREQIALMHSPFKAKQFGKTVNLRPDWEDVKLQIMEQLVEQKFQRSDLREKLISTGNCPLIEGNTWKDKFWGVYRGEGQNHLGKILMRVRSKIMQQDPHA